MQSRLPRRESCSKPHAVLRQPCVLARPVFGSRHEAMRPCPTLPGLECTAFCSTEVSESMVHNKLQKTASDPGLLALFVVAGLQGQCRSNARSSIKKW